MKNNYYLFLLILCFALGLCGALLVSRYSNTFGLLDKSNYRSSHKGTIPKGGGIGILVVFVSYSLFSSIILAFWVPATLLSLISLLGDRTEISPKLRLPIQLIASFSFLYFYYRLQGIHNTEAFNISFSTSSNFSFLFPVFLALFIVATANWYNFMDGINGIAGITAIVGFGLLVATGLFINMYFFLFKFDINVI
ncbi:MAG: hypothetical protein JXB49_15830 [Bacteroidales bacterium]|nr:hypothetical protein [Bacteroidales bacterium]